MEMVFNFCIDGHLICPAFCTNNFHGCIKNNDIEFFCRYRLELFADKEEKCNLDDDDESNGIHDGVHNLLEIDMDPLSIGPPYKQMDKKEYHGNNENGNKCDEHDALFILNNRFLRLYGFRMEIRNGLGIEELLNLLEKSLFILLLKIYIIIKDCV